ncbi:MAG: carbamoyl-phosphate synthase large subunit [Gammaproteobacteria bacterium]
MPADRSIQCILVIGAGPIVIGQACEFDYSGTQACRALVAEGYRVVLINSNPATIMTDLDTAHATYIEPLSLPYLKQVIEIEKPDALLSTMGGQTALNLTLALDDEGFLQKHNIRLLGAAPDSIRKAENRQLFFESMERIGLKCAPSIQIRSVDEIEPALANINLPAIIRPSFTLGGAGGGHASTPDEFRQLIQTGLETSPVSEVQIDQSLVGWKEYELEVVRDRNDNCIIVCSIENIDPMGVHTGDSITVAPALTLTDKEYQNMRDAAIAVLREIGVETGGSNVQFAVNPETGEQLVVEMNPRVSRSSALASKATGFPIAKVAALLAIGYTLDEVRNDCTGGVIPFSFEPSLDYIVTKIPRFDFDKFPQADRELTIRMKSIGEVMAIGSNFQESLQKALRGLENDLCGLDEDSEFQNTAPEEQHAYLQNALALPTENRILHIGEAFRSGWNVQQVAARSKIDPWFLQEIADLIAEEQSLKEIGLDNLSMRELRRLKSKGFSDTRLAKLLNTQEGVIRQKRHQAGIRPVFKRVDTCAAEFPAETAYLYSTYQPNCEAAPSKRRKIAVLGSGPNRIGQGIEFDYCCVHAAQTLKECGIETIMINCNPETVSTDYDISDKLYFEPLSLEDVLEVIQKEQIEGVIVQFGGQTPLKLAQKLQQAGVQVLGTQPDAIHRAEDREEFRKIVQKLQLLQPQNATISRKQDALHTAEKIGFPLIVRPSYVLGGRAMEIVYNPEELNTYIQNATELSPEAPLLLDRFLEDALEIDVEAICDGHDVMIAHILEHVEQAGIHSGDSACSLPPRSLATTQIEEIYRQTRMLALELNVTGLLNVQFALTDGKLFLLEANPRASRTIPFVSKCIGLSLPAIATRAMLGIKIKDQQVPLEPAPTIFAVKEAVFPFNRFPTVDPSLGPEMRSTGEVMGMGRSYAEAFRKSQEASIGTLPQSGKVFISVKKRDRKQVRELARTLYSLGFSLCATKGTAASITQAGLPVQVVNKVSEGSPHAVDLIESQQISMVVNTTEGRQSMLDSSSIRQAALQQGIYMTTTMAGAFSLCQTLNWQEEPEVRSLQAIHRQDSSSDVRT